MALTATPTDHRQVRANIQPLPSVVDPARLQFTISVDELYELDGGCPSAKRVEAGVTRPRRRKGLRGVEHYDLSPCGPGLRNAVVGRSRVHIHDVFDDRRQRPQAGLQSTPFVAANNDRADVGQRAPLRLNTAGIV
jgi:hypothetical protein